MWPMMDNSTPNRWRKHGAKWFEPSRLIERGKLTRWLTGPRENFLSRNTSICYNNLFWVGLQPIKINGHAEFLEFLVNSGSFLDNVLKSFYKHSLDLDRYISGCMEKEDLLLNLTDGRLLCGDSAMNHAKDNYQKTKNPLAVKIQSIAPDKVEVFSFEENRLVWDVSSFYSYSPWSSFNVRSLIRKSMHILCILGSIYCFKNRRMQPKVVQQPKFSVLAFLVSITSATAIMQIAYCKLCFSVPQYYWKISW